MTDRMDMPLIRRLRGARQLVRARLADIDPNPRQPRRCFPQASISALAESIRRHGLLEPLLVRRAATGRYELIAGERRLRALKQLGVEAADALVLPENGQDEAIVALVENLHREPLGYFEEAEAYRAWMDEHGLSQEELAARLVRSPSAVANKLRLLKLPPAVREELQRAGLSERHARALLRLSGSERQLAAARQAAADRLTVRQLETLVARMLTEPLSAPAVRSLCRDHRLFVNAINSTVKALQKSNAAVTSRVVEHEREVEVIVTIPRDAWRTAACREETPGRPEMSTQISAQAQMSVAKTAETC
ncbi:MAG: ParB/RepB/Spo0J family partition protein [Clostridia bacterium]|nr:ParB/RepB/Spo0J family partition protein [Clostridia bacterium]